MLPETSTNEEDFARLTELDERIAKAVAAGRCRKCGGPLHVANYLRKPRGGCIAKNGEAYALRHSLCCGRRGCRKRSLPPSLRFLGRRVYLEVVVVLASIQAQVARTLAEAREATGVPTWTLRRWGSWWRELLPEQAWWRELQGWLVRPPVAAELPRSFLQVLAGMCRPSDVMWMAARCLAPGTTTLPEAARFVRDACPGALPV